MTEADFCPLPCSPLPVIIRGIRDAVTFQSVHYFVQNRPPEPLEQTGISEPSHQCRTDRIRQMNERTAKEGLCQNIIPVTAESPDLGTIVGTVNRSLTDGLNSLIIAHHRNLAMSQVVLLWLKVSAVMEKKLSKSVVRA